MTTTLDLVRVRADFPMLGTTMRGKPLVYFDNGATSLKPRPVLDAIQSYYSDYGVNIHRGVYEMSARATASYDAARQRLRDFIGVTDGKGEVIFTYGATTSLNMAAFGWGRRHLGPGDEIVTTPIEHHANLVPWQQVAQATGARLVFMELADDGSIPLASIERAISPAARIVAVSAMSNVTGYVPPLREIIDRAHAVGARVVLDAAQFASHHTLDVTALGCDALAFSGHKMCGPTGIGVLYATTELLEEMDPWIFGGDMIETVHRDHSTWARIPERFEAGTPNIAGAIGLAAAASYLQSIGMDEIAAHETTLGRYLRERLKTLPWIETVGSDDPSRATGVVSFHVRGVHPHDVGSLLDQQGIAVRTGYHCAQPLMRHFGAEESGTVRASMYLYNTEEEVDRFVSALERLHAILV